MKLSEALSVLILIASALLLSAANKSQSAQPFPREKPPNQAEQRIQNQTAGYAAEQVADKAVTPVGGIESEHDRKKNSTGVTEQQKTDWMVWLTAILSFIALIQALIFFNQYRAMVFSARAQIVVVPAVPTSPPNQTHVVLLVGQPVANAPTTPQPQLTLPIPAAVPNAGLLPGLFTFAPNQHSEFRGTVLNIGNTPAYEFTFDCWMELITPPFEDFPKDAHRWPRDCFKNYLSEHSSVAGYYHYQDRPSDESDGISRISTRTEGIVGSRSCLLQRHFSLPFQS